MTAKIRGLPWALSDFFRATTGRERGGIVMLAAYFDESGTHGNSELITVAGILGDTVDWQDMSIHWKKRLGKVPYFHATECAVQDGPCYGMDKDETNALSADLSSILAKQDVIGVGFSVYRDDWEYAASPRLKEEFGYEPYYFCFAGVVQQVCAWSIKHQGGEPVAFVFAKQCEYEHNAEKLMEVLRAGMTREYIGHFGWSRPQCLAELQAADLYAFETYNELLSQEIDFREGRAALTAPKRENLKTIARGIHQENIFLDTAALFSISEQIDDLWKLKP